MPTHFRVSGVPPRTPREEEPHHVRRALPAATRHRSMTFLLLLLLPLSTQAATGAFEQHLDVIKRKEMLELVLEKIESLRQLEGRAKKEQQFQGAHTKDRGRWSLF